MSRRLALLCAVATSLLLPASASALTVTTAQLKGGALRVEGTNAASGFVTATSSGAGLDLIEPAKTKRITVTISVK